MAMQRTQQQQQQAQRYEQQYGNNAYPQHGNNTERQGEGQGQPPPQGGGQSENGQSNLLPGGRDPEYDDTAGDEPRQIVYTADHAYDPDAHGDHLVRVVTPVGVYAEFVGTPGAELVILAPPHQPDVAPNSKQKLQAHIKYQDPDMDPRQVTGSAEWTSSRRQVATVGNKTGMEKGVVTGRNAGTTQITVTYGGLKATKKVACRPPDAQTLSIEPAGGQPGGQGNKIVVQKGQKLPLRATATLTDGKTQAVTNKTRFESSNPQVATVSNSGEVTGVSGGKAVITGTYQNQEGKPVANKVTVTVELDDKNSEKPEDSTKPETGENSSETPETGSDSGNSSDSGAAEGDSTFPSNGGGVQDSGQNSGSDSAQGGAQDAGQAQDPNQGQGGVQPQYTQ